MEGNFLTSKKYLNISDLMLLLALYIGAIFGARLFFSGNNSEYLNGVDPSSMEGMGIITSMTYLLMSATVLIFFLVYRAFRAPNGEKGLDKVFRRGKFSPLILLWGAILIMSVQLIVNPLTATYNNSTEQYYSMMEMIEAAGAFGMITTVLFAPFFEELLFRGVLFGDIDRGYGKFTAIMVSSLIFGVIHLNWVQILPAFLSGIVLCYIYTTTKSIWAPIFVHTINNAITQIMFVVLPKEEYIKPMKDMFVSETLYDIVYGTAILFFAIMVVRFIYIIVLDNKERKKEFLIQRETVEVAINNDETGSKEIKEAEKSEAPKTINDLYKEQNEDGSFLRDSIMNSEEKR